MKIVFLDAKTIGEDLDLSGYEQLGAVSYTHLHMPMHPSMRII